MERWGSRRCAVFLPLSLSLVNARIVNEEDRSERALNHLILPPSPLLFQTTPKQKQYSFSLTTFSPSGKLVQVRVSAFGEKKRNEKRRGMKKTDFALKSGNLDLFFSSTSHVSAPPPSNLLPRKKKQKNQIEHALNAVNAGATALGIRAVDGVVLATEKKARSPLVDGATISKLSPVTPNSGLAYAGMGPDSRVLVRRARKSAQAYLRTYGEEIPVAQLCRETAAVMQEFTQRGGVRPFGVSLLMAGVDAGGGPQLYQIDPSGSYFAWKASAVGKNAQDAR